MHQYHNTQIISDINIEDTSDNDNDNSDYTDNIIYLSNDDFLYGTYFIYI